MKHSGKDDYEVMTGSVRVCSGDAEERDSGAGDQPGAALLSTCCAVQPDHCGAPACWGHRGPLLPLCLPPTLVRP